MSGDQRESVGSAVSCHMSHCVMPHVAWLAEMMRCGGLPLAYPFAANVLQWIFLRSTSWSFSGPCLVTSCAWGGSPLVVCTSDNVMICCPRPSKTPMRLLLAGANCQEIVTCKQPVSSLTPIHRLVCLSRPQIRHAALITSVMRTASRNRTGSSAAVTASHLGEPPVLLGKMPAK